MIRARSQVARARRRVDAVDIAATLTFAYLLTLGALAWRDGTAASQVANAIIGTGLAVLYILRAPRFADRMDRMLLAALLLFAITCVFSGFPRQSLNSFIVCSVYVAGLFLLRGVLRSEPSRNLFMAALRFLSALLTLTVALQIILPFLDWWGLTGGTVVPPLDMRVQAAPWTSRYEAALLLVLLYPSWWTGNVSWRRAIAATVIGALVVATCVLVGSRTIWLATAVGCVVVGIPTLRRVAGNRSLRLAAFAVFSVLLATVLLAPGIWAALGERFGRVASVLERASVWGPALGEWSERPLLGLGPSSFPWVLQRTDYFQTHAYSPRQPDSAIVHLLVEAGLLGVCAAAIVLAAVIPPLVRSRSRPALFAGASWLIAGVGLNSAEPAFLVAALIGWVAYTCPRDDRGVKPTPGRGRAVFVGTAAAATLVVIAVASMTAATVAYAIAREHANRGDLDQATFGMRVAATLDPALALYQRQLGTVYLLQNDAESAVHWLRRAATLNPSDDLTWRSLGLALGRRDEPVAAAAAYDRALVLRRSEPSNILLAANAARADANLPSAEALLAEAVQAWPMITGAPGWADLVGGTTSELLDRAHERWLRGAPSPEPSSTQPLLIALMSGADPESLRPEHRREAWPLRAAYIDVMRCGSPGRGALTEAPRPAQREPTYWELEIRQRSLAGLDAADAIRAHRIMTQSEAFGVNQSDRLNPLWENGSRGSSHDTWGYGRLPIYWPDPGTKLPFPNAGFTRWHLDPAGAVREAGLEDVLPDCLRQSAASVLATN